MRPGLRRGAGQQIKADRIDQHLCRTAPDHHVAVLGGIAQFEAVLGFVAPVGQHGYAQRAAALPR